MCLAINWLLVACWGGYFPCCLMFDDCISTQMVMPKVRIGNTFPAGWDSLSGPLGALSWPQRTLERALERCVLIKVLVKSIGEFNILFSSLTLISAKLLERLGSELSFGRIMIGCPILSYSWDIKRDVGPIDEAPDLDLLIYLGMGQVVLLAVEAWTLQANQTKIFLHASGWNRSDIFREKLLLGSGVRSISKPARI